MNNSDKTGTPKFKRIVAIVCIVLLLSCYLMTLILAIMGKTIYNNLFGLCLIGTIVLPILAFVIIWLYGRYNDRKVPGDPEK